MKSEQSMHTAIDALQNMANHANPCIKIHPKPNEDRRKTVPKYFANIDNNSISPVLDYDCMNCFLLGFAKGKNFSWASKL